MHKPNFERSEYLHVSWVAPGRLRPQRADCKGIGSRGQLLDTGKPMPERFHWTYHWSAHSSSSVHALSMHFSLFALWSNGYFPFQDTRSHHSVASSVKMCFCSPCGRLHEVCVTLCRQQLQVLLWTNANGKRRRRLQRSISDVVAAPSRVNIAERTN